MAELRQRLVSLAIGVVGLAVSLAIALYGYTLLPPQVAGLDAVWVGLLVLAGMTGALAALFLLILPALFPVR